MVKAQVDQPVTQEVSGLRLNLIPLSLRCSANLADYLFQVNKKANLREMMCNLRAMHKSAEVSGVKYQQ